MARKYDTTNIDGVVYELHGVKNDGKKIGFVPVRTFANVDAFRDYILNLSDGDVELAIADWQYGNAVRLQGMARSAVSGDTFTDAKFNKMYNELDKETLLEYHGRFNDLKAYCKQLYEQQQSDVETDEEHIWEELL